jgi:hypothetical protein
MLSVLKVGKHQENGCSKMTQIARIAFCETESIQFHWVDSTQKSPIRWFLLFSFIDAKIGFWPCDNS